MVPNEITEFFADLLVTFPFIISKVSKKNMFVGFLGNPDPFLGGGEYIPNIAFAGWSFGGCTNPTIHKAGPRNTVKHVFFSSTFKGVPIKPYGKLLYVGVKSIQGYPFTLGHL